MNTRRKSARLCKSLEREDPPSDNEECEVSDISDEDSGDEYVPSSNDSSDIFEQSLK